MPVMSDEKYKNELAKLVGQLAAAAVEVSAAGLPMHACLMAGASVAIRVLGGRVWPDDEAPPAPVKAPLQSVPPEAPPSAEAG